MFGTVDGCLDEGHATDAVGNFWIVEGGGVGGCPIDDGAEVVGEVAVDIGKSFEIALGMASRDACVRGGIRPEVAEAGAADFRWAVVPFHKERVGFLLVPLEATEFAIDANGEVILLADGNLGRVEDALRAVVEAEEDIAVVIQRAALNEGGEVGGEIGRASCRERVYVLV